MRDRLPKNVHKNECGILNLDSDSGAGTHWTAYYKRGPEAVYFDSFGNLRPPVELLKYLKSCRVKYNHKQYQTYDTVNCGHLCLKFLYNESR
jgi:hypothetical protein